MKEKRIAEMEGLFDALTDSELEETFLHECTSSVLLIIARA
jgi:hypothetical protein